MIGRPLLFVLWSFALWGSLMAVAYARLLVRSGFDASRLAPPPGAEGGLWSWLNLASAAVAPLFWAAVGYLYLRARRPRR
jgi:hypothetical protein